MIIGIDFDSTLNTLIDDWVAWLSAKYDVFVTPQDVVDWDITKAFPTLTKTQVFEPLHSPEFWSTVGAEKDAISYCWRLLEAGHRLLVITSTYYRNAPYKFDNCLFRLFPQFKKEDIIITYDKSLIKCDVLIDDADHNFKGCTCNTILLSKPYNQNHEFAQFVAKDWSEIYEIIRELNIIDKIYGIYGGKTK